MTQISVICVLIGLGVSGINQCSMHEFRRAASGAICMLQVGLYICKLNKVAGVLF